uniref:Uncharacterized protein n=1 Tax=viral metagenome TaxID=1070528 RepID=A0A6C0IVE1_9ZZZZ
MENFIEKNISSVNKNNYINIKLGNNLDTSIFDYSISKKKIDCFINECSKENINFIKADKFCQYKVLDCCVEINNNKTKYVTYKTKDYLIDNKNLFSILITLDNIEINTSNIVSVYNYNSITWIQEYIYNHNNILTIVIKDNLELDNDENIKNQYYSLSLNIKKSNNNIFKYLEMIINIFSEC